jgi:predicted histidine transporter YuiF (NhaC family)
MIKQPQLKIAYLFLFIAYMNILDGITTYYAVSSGMGTEANPLMHYVISKGMMFFVTLKIIISLFLVLVAKYHKNYKNQYRENMNKFHKWSYKYDYELNIVLLTLLLLVAFFYVALVINNTIIIYGG